MAPSAGRFCSYLKTTSPTVTEEKQAPGTVMA
jgi:hypothetical protein